jgi:hypothetical protein
MAALVVRAIDQKAANARGTHFPEGDFLLAAGESGHAPLKRGQTARTIRYEAYFGGLASRHFAGLLIGPLHAMTPAKKRPQRAKGKGAPGPPYFRGVIIGGSPEA